MTDCTQNRDPLKLVREGTNQEQRLSPALDPAYAPVNERNPAHGMVFAQAYAAFLKYHNSNNVAEGDWKPFFSEDVSVRLAVAAVQDVAYYKSNVKEYFDFLNNLDHESNEAGLKDHLGYLFGCAATLANQLDVLKEGLPTDISLKGALQNRIQSQLAPAFKKLILYYRDGLSPDPPPPPVVPYHNDVEPTFDIMGATWSLKDIRDQGLSKDWIVEDDATQWANYLFHLDDLLKYPSTQIYGSGVTVFERINHIATHNLFTSVFDLFLKVYAHTVNEAKQALEATITKWDRHEPHYALFLAYLQLFEHARTEMNTLTGRHMDFYYREILRLKEKAAEPGKAHLLVELAKQAPTHFLKSGALFKAGKDDLGNPAFFANDRDFVANQAKVTGLKMLYRHKNAPDDTLNFENGRLFASPLANSADGLGAKLTTADQSWHPFFNKTYEDGKLIKINMPQAEVGFAIASHYLWLAEGERTIAIDFTVTGNTSALTPDRKNEIICLVTTEKGWLEKSAKKFITESSVLRLEINLSGADPAVTPYSPKTHGYQFSTNLPVLLVKLEHQDDHEYLYRLVQDRVIERIDLTVDVKGLKSLAISNDFGPVDTSKPFQPFGASPIAGNALIIGSKEVFQKTLATADVKLKWRSQPAPFGTIVNIKTAYLSAGVWRDSISDPISIKEVIFPLGTESNKSVKDEPDFSEPEFYSTKSRHGFLRLTTTASFGQSNYEQALIDYIRKLTDNDKELTSNVNEAVKVVSKLITGVDGLATLDGNVIDKLDSLVAPFETIIGNLTAGIGDVVTNTKDVLKELKDLISGIEIQWPINTSPESNGSGGPDLIETDDDEDESIVDIVDKINEIATNITNLTNQFNGLADQILGITGFACFAENIHGLTDKFKRFAVDVSRLATGIIETHDLITKQVVDKAEQLSDIVLDLTSDIQNNISQFTQKIREVADNVTNLIENIEVLTGSQEQKPLPPTGPFITELKIDYSAKQSIILNSSDVLNFNKRQSHFFHLAPFGHSEQHPLLNSDQKVFLVPQFNFHRDNFKNDSHAEFYIGLTGLKPPQTLALLVQVADGTADPLSTKANIHWSYLSGNEWIDFAEHDVQDDTDGLLNSGIITFSIPDEASSGNTILPSGQHWLRAAVADESDSVCRLRSVSAQGFSVTFQNQDNDPVFPTKVLPAGTISKLDQPDAAVKKVTQPFATFGGRGAEAPTAFYTRISERLRHKDRAIALWDCERLVLEAFPQIYKAMCLNHTHYEPTESGSGIYRELAPGHVTVVTIPNQQFQNLRDPLRPYTSLGLLLEIDAFLHKRLSCFVKLHVKNPQFEEVWVDFKVRLYDGHDETFYENKLREDITRFLSPWAFPGGGSPSFGGKVYKSVLINFVEEQLYVDYVTDFQLFHGFHDIDGVLQTVEKFEVEGSTAVSILVSAPANKHIIQVIKPAAEETPGEKCPCDV